MRMTSYSRSKLASVKSFRCGVIVGWSMKKNTQDCQSKERITKSTSMAAYRGRTIFRLIGDHSYEQTWHSAVRSASSLSRANTADERWQSTFVKVAYHSRRANKKT